MEYLGDGRRLRGLNSEGLSGSQNDLKRTKDIKGGQEKEKEEVDNLKMLFLLSYHR